MNKERIDNAIKNTNIAKDMFIKKCDNCIELQKRIDKAIKFVEALKEEIYDNEEYIIDNIELNIMLDILRGKDNE